MSWNLLIHKTADNELYPLGPYDKVRDALNEEFPHLIWSSESKCSLNVDRGFDLELELFNGIVLSITTNGGYDHLIQFARLASEYGWDILDFQSGVNLDLASPYSACDKNG